MTISRRCTAGLLAAVLLAAGCGSGDPADEAAAGANAGGSDAFPVTIEHKFGSTEITEEPQRVLSLGFSDQDFVLALGVVPVAVRYWYGDESDPFRDWADDALAEAGADEADIEVLNMPELNFERISLLRPDVIIAMYAGLTEADYGTLTDIAPVVTQTDEYNDYGVPWQEVATTIGTALGRADAAADLVTGIEQDVAAAAEANPQWVGQTLGVVTGHPRSEGGTGFFASSDPRSRFFTSLGFEIPAEFDEIAGDLFYGTVSGEQLDIIDTDVVVWDQLSFIEGGRETVESDPLVAQLTAVQDNRVVWLDGELEEAFGWQSPLSLPIAVDGVVAQLETVAP